MAQDPYGPCNCGSGKKFKWCCQPIFVGINRAWEQEAAGQHDTALRLMDEVVKDHESNPEVWGQKARLLYSQGKVEEAETALQKAFDLNPNYPAGLLLRASFRFQEGEIPGALLLAQRAAEAYDPEARSFLAEVYYLIFECEMRQNRPVAGRAALRLVTHFAPLRRSCASRLTRCLVPKADCRRRPAAHTPSAVPPRPPVQNAPPGIRRCRAPIRPASAIWCASSSR